MKTLRSFQQGRAARFGSAPRGYVQKAPLEDGALQTRCDSQAVRGIAKRLECERFSAALRGVDDERKAPLEDGALQARCDGRAVRGIAKRLECERFSAAFAVAIALLTPSASAALAPGQWTPERAQTWYESRPWMVGCNFLPSTAVNDIEMWEPATFDAATIDRELGWARALGFNTVRVFLNFVVWQADAEGLKTRFTEFLDMAGRHGIGVMPILFDDCNFAGRVAAAGPQPDPVPGVHNSQWVSSPPLAMVTNRAAWPVLERYVKDMVGTFGQDDRVWVWDLYNEPGASGLGDQSQPLMEATFAWARAAKPGQPLTIGAWVDFEHPFTRRMMELSDVVSFHGYDAPSGIEAKLALCGTYRRPVLCTEYLVRRDGNTFENLLPLFRDRRIGCWNWGLVAGRTQTYFPWGSPKDAPEPARWQHDLFRRDGTPYDTQELAFVKATIAAAASPASRANLALVATASTSYVSGHESLSAVNDGSSPAHSDDKSAGAYGNWPRTGTQWVQYDWTQPIRTDRIEVYWFDDQRGVRLPTACRLQYWDGTAFVPVADAAGLGREANRFNPTTFPPITTTRLRLEFDGRGTFSTGLLEWRVFDSGDSPNFPPVVDAGVDRAVVLSGQTYLEGRVRDDGKPRSTPAVRWSVESGPGPVAFSDPQALATTARFVAVGEHVLRLTANDGAAEGVSTVHVSVGPPPPTTVLEPVPTTAYRLSSPFWRPRARALIVEWIPHCIRKIEDPATPEGGIQNFVEAGRKLAGATDAKHVGAVFANTWVYNTLESIFIALQLDPGDDAELRGAQAALRRTAEDWIPKILSAQEPDGYLHTMYTLRGSPLEQQARSRGLPAGYFIEAAIAHWHLTRGQDPRLYQAAKRLADCWVRHLGPAPKKAWYPGHQAMEMALVRLARLVDAVEGQGRGGAYVALARFLLDQRQHGEEYDQSHVPVTRQYEAVGHAVRAVYSYAGMADIAMATGDLDYHSAVQSLSASILNRKYYVTGGVGSGETAEGFGKDYSLPNNAYCESCAGCGQLFFQHRLNHAYHEARHADCFEETLYNAILGGVDLEGRNFTYTNPLDSSGARYPWHVCPCCVGNLPRTLLSLPTWMYALGPDRLYVNLFVGSTVTLDGLAGTRVEVCQTTDYPWNGQVTLTLNPAQPKAFAVHLRIPNRATSPLYTPTPAVEGIRSLSVNGSPVPLRPERGYAVLTRTWQAGDTIRWEVPLVVQRVFPSDKIAATRGRVALRSGPLIYNFESVDQSLEGVLGRTMPLTTEWRSDLLGGVQVIRGTFTDGEPWLAIPNYARLNRGGRSVVWIRSE
ncbi:MAG: glycoside hydrolase family 127 protein [Verrucomicrobiales bacterium]|nr:glycoside hydrolase family 127 protein [Verrucomicrobiales bacterium]